MKARARVVILVVAVAVLVWIAVIGVAADTWSCWDLGASTPPPITPAAANAPNVPDWVHGYIRMGRGKWFTDNPNQPDDPNTAGFEFMKAIGAAILANRIHPNQPNQ